jgi:two-component system sensor histidine kinase PilS (NtrC family)
MYLSESDTRFELAESGDLTWKPLRLLSFYRLILSSLLMVLFLGISGNASFGNTNPLLFSITGTFYVGFSLLVGISARLRRPRYELQSFGQVLVDISVVTLLLHASGGLESGLGILLIIAVASGSVLLPGRMAFLFAALATFALMAETVYSGLLVDDLADKAYMQAGLYGLALFATAGLTYLLTRRIHESETLARRRGIDIANLSKLNTHIIQRLLSGIMVTDHLHKIQLMNRTARKLLGVVADCEGLALDDVSPALSEKLHEWRKHPDREPSLLQINSRSTSILPQFTLLGTANGIGALIFLEDTAAMERQAQQLKLASLGRLTASIAHEIRNPLGAISHATQLLSESDQLNSDDQRLMSIIGDHTQRVNKVVEDILQLSRPGASVPRKIVLQDWLEKFAKEFIQSGICEQEQLEIINTTPNLEVYLDPGQLHQVTWNLCQNAFIHNKNSGSSLHVEICTGRTEVSQIPYIEITDNGKGIDANLVGKLFEPFVTTSTRGSGLGLYIAREICESNEARLSYHEGPAGGCTFRVTFPDTGGLSASSFT